MSHSCDECYDIYDEREVVARKTHQCGACEEPIHKGHRYTRIGCLFDGKWSTIIRCVRCQIIHKHLRTMDEWGDMWPDEQLNCGEEYRDHWGKDPPPEIAALAFWRPGDPLDTEETKS